jgi:hypothetical protein
MHDFVEERTRRCTLPASVALALSAPCSSWSSDCPIAPWASAHLSRRQLPLELRLPPLAPVIEAWEIADIAALRAQVDQG